MALNIMKLVTFQTMDALSSLINNGYLECKENYINTLKSLATLGTNLTVGCLGLFNPAKDTFFYRLRWYNGF